MARDEKDYMTNPSLMQRVTSYITQGGRPEYQEATEHPKTLAVYNEPYAKQNGASLGTFEYYVDDEGGLTKGLADMGISDPFTRINSQIDLNVSFQAPKVKIDGDRVVVQAPKEVLSSPLVSQIKEELQSLKGADLKSEETQNAIKALNEEISTGLKDSLLNSATGWTREQYNNYQLNRQRVSKANPMNSGDYIIGIKKDGEEAKMTFRDWVNYYREAYNTQERMDAFKKSFYSSNPYERTMALVMGQGGKKPVYGFDTAEKMGELWKAFTNQMGKVPEGIFRHIAEDNNTKRVESLSDELKISPDAIRKFNINNEEKFNQKKESISGKRWKDLSEEDKAFVLLVGVSKENNRIRSVDRDALSNSNSENLKNMSSPSDYYSRTAIESILKDSSFDKYKELRNSYDTWQGYEDWTQEGEKELAETADWSGSEQWWGNLTGTIGRYLWENALVQSATGGISAKSLANPKLIRGGEAGGFSMNSVSDKIAGSAELGTGIVGSLAKHGIAPTSKLGKNALQFTANLVGTVPEDIIQTSVDNVLTYNEKENANLFNPEQMSENFRNNLITMAGVNILRAGMSAVKRARLAKQIAKAADLDEELVIGKISDAEEIATAKSKGNSVKTDNGKVSIVDVNGKETVLENVTPEEASMVQRATEQRGAQEPSTPVSAPEDVRSNIAPWKREELKGDWNGQVKAFRQYVSQNSPIDLETGNRSGVKGSIAWWLHDANNMFDNGVEFDRRWESIPQEVRERILNEGTFGKSVERNGLVTAMSRLGIDNVVDPDLIDLKYAEYLWEQSNDATGGVGLGTVKTGEESAPETAAETATTVAEEMVEPVKKKTKKEWKENPTYDQDYSIRRAEDVLEGRAPLSDYLDEQKERMWEAFKNSNQGTETFYHRDEFGQIDRRNTVSYNGSLYRELYEEYGGKPTKAEFGEAFDDVIKNGENSRYYYGFKEFDNDGKYALGYNAGNEEIDTILALKEDVENTPARTAMPEEAGDVLRGEPESGTATTRTEADEPRAETETTRVETEEPKAETETTKTETEEPKVMVEVDTVDGPARVETTDYTFNDIDDATTPGTKIENTPAGTKHWHTKALEYIVNLAQDKLFREFRTRFGDITTSEFDWIFENSKNGMTPDQIIGTVDPKSGRTITQNTIDAAKWWGNNPIVQKLRMGSRKSLGLEGDVNILGYLPHTNYDPANLSYDEALTGQLWREYTGKSTTDNNGNFIGYGGTFEGRFRTYASNMLWDIRGKEVAAAKLIEEAQMEGKTLTPEQAMKAVEGGQDIQAKVNDAPSTKALTKELSSGSGYDKKVYQDIDKKIKEEAPKSGISKAYHDNYSDVYVGANSQAVQSQPDRLGSVSFNQQSDTMRKIITRDGSMYDNGGADIVYASQNAVELVKRFAREGGDFREMLIEFIEKHSGRSPKYAEAVADRWIAKMSDGPGKLTKGKAISSLSSSMRAEGMSRLRRWLVRADYNGFNAKTRGFMDDFLFRHVQMDSIKKNRSIRVMMTRSLNWLTKQRYRALFYGNIKNALLQVSELNRLFTVFKWGDVGKTLQRLATDEGFRARVDTYVEAVSPETSYLDAELYGKYKQVSDSAKVDNDGITFRELAGDIGDTADKIGLAPINAAETLKNRTMIAALVQEADRMGLSGDEALRHIRSRFERVALANNEMGRIGLASNPLAKPMLFLQNFQIRELGMHYYNIKDATGMAASTPKKILEASKYLTKVLGSKLATTLILARLGYSATQTLGIDPLGLADNYTGLSEEEMNALDKQISGGILTPFFAGGMTSLIADMYFMARAAYEDSNRQTITDDAEQNLKENNLLNDLRFWEQTSTPSSVENGEFFRDLASDFAPGNVFFNRLGQMNEMMDTGWATSATGNKMYTAPNDATNIMLGYLFGRSATQNALQYNQTYGNDLGQTLSRTAGKAFANLGAALGLGDGYQQFDPIDTKNYSDWFSGDDNDRQQFEKGRRYFQQQRDRILDEYEDAIRKSRASKEDVAEAKNNMNQRLENLYEQLDRFVNAYERKNGTVDSAMTKQIVNLLNTGRDVLGDTPEEAEERGKEEYNKALERYSQRGYSPVGTYTGPSEKEPDKEVKYQGSPQYRTAVSGKYTLNSEAVAVLKEADRVLADVRKELKQAVSDAYDAKDYDRLAEIQKQYLASFDKAVAPVIATYGNGILSSTDVVNQMKDMLSTGTVSRSGDLIPSDQYRKDKYGRYRSMPLETVDVKKWAQQRYSDDIYKQPTVRSYTAAGDDIMEIRRLISQGKPDRARARALQLKVRVDNQKRTISSEDYNWLLGFLNNGGK